MGRGYPWILTRVCYHRKFSVVFVDNLQPLHKCITPALYFAWPKLKCFCHPWLTLLLPQQKFAPCPLSQRGGEPSAATGLLQHGHIKELAQKVPLTATAGVQCVFVCVNIWIDMYECVHKCMQTRSVASQHEWKNYTVSVFEGGNALIVQQSWYLPHLPSWGRTRSHAPSFCMM